MTAQEYVNQINALVPSKAFMIEKGLNSSFVDTIYPYFSLKRRDDPIAVWNNDPVLDLCYNYDFGKYYEVFDFNISFPDFYEEENRKERDYYLFGSFDTDGVAIIRKTGQIVLLDHEDNYQTILAYCAENSSKFLDALFRVAQFQLEVIYDSTYTLIDDVSISSKILEECAILASSKRSFRKYLKFYMIWLHCF